ncbi:MAG TPA: hypothetical protein VM536_05620, partial [Chloroflexia bacterium]|nr:hypothetical protein [Chloroflexia bacterium]
GELFGAPRPLVSAAVPVFFQQLAAQPSPCLTELQRPLSGCDALLELPQDPWVPLGMYHAAVSRHPMVGGYTSRHYPYRFAGDAPGVAQLVAPTAADLGPDIYTPSLRDLALRTMDYYGLRYVVVHPLDEYRAADALQATLSALFGPTGQADGSLTIYTVPRGPQDQAFLYLGAGWHALEQDAAGTRWHWTEQAATVRVLVPPGTAGAYTLQLDVYSVSGPRTLVAHLDGQEIGRSTVSPAPGGRMTLPVTLTPGQHTLTLASVEPAITSPGDPRAISLGYHTLGLTRSGQGADGRPQAQP